MSHNLTRASVAPTPLRWRGEKKVDECSLLHRRGAGGDRRSGEALESLRH